MDGSRRTGFYQQTGKRILDVVMAIVLLFVVALPFLLILLIYFFIPGYSPFFIQERVGFREQTFRLIKFRTLVNDPSRPLQARRFFFGDVLRFTNLDEIPQLINILRGEMSFVGPRPLPLEYLSMYSEEQRTRHTVKPGITGWAQVNGRHTIPWVEKFRFDIYYVNHISLVLDLMIFFKTIVLLLSLRKDQSLNEQKFTGNKNA
jgi:lipopolysaccharide/colanic/teichoic acid biosynthesis glycosyltransferase